MHGSTTSRSVKTAVCAVALLSLVACGASQQTVRAGDGTPATSTATPAGEAWPLVGGGTLDIGTLTDQPLALWFWAPG